MPKKNIFIRNVDTDTFNQFRARAKAYKIKQGKAFTEAMKLWTEKNPL